MNRMNHGHDTRGEAAPAGGLGLMFFAAAIGLFTVLFIVGAFGYALLR